MEANFFQSKFRKFLNVFFMSFFYGLRPMIVCPKVPTKWEIINFISQFSFDAVIIYFWGWSALGYFILSTFLGLGLHPLSGHFIQEHFVTTDDAQETYSYYGPLNYLLLNVGYHNEHHDFPRIPGSRLPKLLEIAPEFYKDITFKTSYIYTIYEYIFTDGFGPYNRVKRTKEDHDRSRRQTLKQYTSPVPDSGDNAKSQKVE
jgi:sphingolipid delta-4 desaturase